MSTGLTVHAGQSLDELAEAFASDLDNLELGALEPVWTVLPSSATRQWLDATLCRYVGASPGHADGVVANLRYFFPSEIVRTIEQAALETSERRWADWNIDPLTFRVLRAASTNQEPLDFASAKARAEELDEIIRWRPELLDNPTSAKLSPAVRTLMSTLDLFNHGPRQQTHEVLTQLANARPSSLPKHLVIFGLTNVPGGRSFTQLVATLATHCAVRVYLPVLSTDPTEPREQGATLSAQFSWRQDLDTTVALWSDVTPRSEWINVPPTETPASPTLLAVQQHLRGRGGSVAQPPDGSLRVIGCVGNDRQIEVTRDVVLALLRDYHLSPHDVLVMSCDLAAVESSVDRHWAYSVDSTSDPLRAARLPHEFAERANGPLRNRLGASIALLKLIGNLATLEQIENFVSLECVSRALSLSSDEIERLWLLAREGHLSYGVTADERRSMQADGVVGTWERLVDRIASAALYPTSSSDLVAESSPPPLGEDRDYATVAKLAPLLRLLSREFHRRESPTKLSLDEWCSTLTAWLDDVVPSHDADDDSFERALGKVASWARDADASLHDVVLTFKQFLDFWRSRDANQSRPLVYGRGGVLLASPPSLSFAKYKAVVIVGFDEDKLLSAPLRSTAMTPARLGDPDPRRAFLASLLAGVLSATDHLVITCNNRDEQTNQAIPPTIALQEFLDLVRSVVATDSPPLLHDAPRHAFLPSSQNFETFDSRLRDLRETNHAVPRVLTPEMNATQELSLQDLRRFLRDPAGQYLRHALRALTPPELEEGVTPPRLTPGHLSLYQLRSTYVEQFAALVPPNALYSELLDSSTWDMNAVAREILHRLSSDERTVGDIPAVLWSSALKQAELHLFACNMVNDLVDFQRPESADSLWRPLTLDDGRVLTLSRLGEPPFDVYEDHSWVWTNDEREAMLSTPLARLNHNPSSMGNVRIVKNVLLDVLDLLILTVTAPHTRSTVVSSFLTGNAKPYERKTGATPKDEFRLNPMFVLRFEGTANDALRALASLVDLYDRASREPLALFRATTVAAALPELGANPWSAWDSSHARGDDIAPSNQILFPYTYDELERQTGGTLPFLNEIRTIVRDVRWSLVASSKRPPGSVAMTRDRFAVLGPPSPLRFASFSDLGPSGGA